MPEQRLRQRPAPGSLLVIVAVSSSGETSGAGSSAVQVGAEATTPLGVGARLPHAEVLLVGPAAVSQTRDSRVELGYLRGGRRELLDLGSGLLRACRASAADRMAAWRHGDAGRQGPARLAPAGLCELLLARREPLPTLRRAAPAAHRARWCALPDRGAVRLTSSRRSASTCLASSTSAASSAPSGLPLAGRALRSRAAWWPPSAGSAQAGARSTPGAWSDRRTTAPPSYARRTWIRTAYGRAAADGDVLRDGFAPWIRARHQPKATHLSEVLSTSSCGRRFRARLNPGARGTCTARREAGRDAAVQRESMASSRLVLPTPLRPRTPINPMPNSSSTFVKHRKFSSSRARSRMLRRREVARQPDARSRQPVG